MAAVRDVMSWQGLEGNGIEPGRAVAKDIQGQVEARKGRQAACWRDSD